MRTSAALVVLVAALSPRAARAVKIDTGSELQLRFDNTLRYTAAARISGRSAALLANINADDGNRNFDPGLISQRLDLLSELDLTYRGVGARVSGAAWFDLRPGEGRLRRQQPVQRGAQPLPGRRAPTRRLLLARRPGRRGSALNAESAVRHPFNPAVRRTASQCRTSLR
jgi:hypothetical protein